MNTAISIARPGGAVGRVGVPQEQTIPGSEPAFYNNVMVGGGVAPVRAYIEELLPDVFEGKIAARPRVRSDRYPRRRPGRLPRDERSGSH